MQLLQSITV